MLLNFLFVPEIKVQYSSKIREKGTKCCGRSQGQTRTGSGVVKGAG